MSVLPAILIVSASRNLVRGARRALGSAGYQVEAAGGDRAAVAQRLQAFDGMCIIDADDPRDEVRWLLDLLRDQRPQVIPLLISHESDHSLIIDLLREERLNNLIAKHGALSSTDLIDENELIVTCSKLFRGDIFGLEKYLPSWAIKVHSAELGSTQDRQLAMAELESFLGRIDCYGPIRSSILLVADELLMNAIFSAPRDARGQAKYAEVDRRERFQLEPAERIQFRFGCDGRNVALSVRDQFGSLDRQVIVKYLTRCWGREQATVEDKKGGAGLGLHMVFNSITQLAFNIHAGHATEVIASFYVRSGSRAFRASGRSMNLFFIQE